MDRLNLVMTITSGQISVCLQYMELATFSSHKAHFSRQKGVLKERNKLLAVLQSSLVNSIVHTYLVMLIQVKFIVSTLLSILNFAFHNFSFGQYRKMREAIDKYEGGLEAFSRGYEKFGFTRRSQFLFWCNMFCICSSLAF